MPRRHRVVVPVDPDELRAGEQVEFFSGEGGGKWKRGVIVDYPPSFGDFGKTRNSKMRVRIQTGPGVYINRKRKDCRRLKQ